jgi:hypothetical protein
LPVSNDRSRRIISRSSRCSSPTAVCSSSREAPEAERLFARVVGSRTARVGDADARTAEARAWLGIAQARQGRHAEAEPLLTATVALLRNHPRYSREARESDKALAALARR